jgi:putative PIG3 family NAD(P)H quinone oxidoreductase
MPGDLDHRKIGTLQFLTFERRCGILGPVKAVVISEPGPPDVLEIREVGDPVPGPDEVVIRVRASALNRADLLQRLGRYPAPPGSPADIPGLEYAGEVERCGPEAHDLAVGERVMGIVGGGAHAERLAAHHATCLRVPDGFSWEQAAATPQVFLTAFDALVVQAAIRGGETLLLHAAASGVGIAAAQIAARSGASVIGLSRDPRKRDLLMGLGLDAVLDSGSERLVSEVRKVAGDRGVDVVLDLVGASMARVNLEVLATGGRWLLQGLLGGTSAEIDLATLLRKRITIRGSVLRPRPLREKIALVRRFAREGLPLLVSGALLPTVDSVFPMDRVTDAHVKMESNSHFGKIVLRMEP